MELLDEAGVVYTQVDYYERPFTARSLRGLLAKAGLRPRDALRRRASQFKELGLADEAIGDEAIIAAIVAHPDLLERPIFEVGDRAVLARPVEAARALL